MSTIAEQDRLEQVISELAAYEQPVTAEQCEQAITAVQALVARVRQVTEGTCQEEESAWERQGVMAMVRVHYAIERAEEARLQLAAFAPVSHSTKMSALRRRRVVVYHLREFARAATETLAREEVAPPPRPRPDYLRVVEPDDQGMGTEGEVTP